MHQWPVGQGTRRHWLSAHWTRNQWGVRGALAVAMAGMATLHTRHAVLRCRTYLLLGWAPSRRVHTGTAPRAKLPSLYFASAIGLLPPQTQLRELIPLAISVTSRWLRHYKVSRSLDVPGRRASPPRAGRPHVLQGTSSDLTRRQPSSERSSGGSCRLI
jgi:hypothetical protein